MPPAPQRPRSSQSWHAVCKLWMMMRTPPKYRHWIVSSLGACLYAARLGAGRRARALTGRTSSANRWRNRSDAAIPPLSDRQRFLIGPLEPNLELERCRLPVAAGRHRRTMQDRATVELRCQDPKSGVICAGQSHQHLNRGRRGSCGVMGSVLRAADLRVEQHDITEHRGDSWTTQHRGRLTANRPIPGGARLPPISNWWPPGRWRSQSVTLVADAGGMSVRMAARL